MFFPGAREEAEFKRVSKSQDWGVCGEREVLSSPGCLADMHLCTYTHVTRVFVPCYNKHSQGQPVSQNQREQALGKTTPPHTINTHQID